MNYNRRSIEWHRQLVKKYSAPEWWERWKIVDSDASVTPLMVLEDMFAMTTEAYPELKQEWFAALEWHPTMIEHLQTVSFLGL